MSDETFPVTLAGRTWSLPHLPFRVVKRAQPVLTRLSHDVVGSLSSPDALAGMDEARLDELVGAVHVALAEVDKDLTLAALLDLKFSFGDLAGAMPSVLRACGLALVPLGKEAAAGGAAGE